MPSEIQIARTERVDDIPLLLEQMERMKIASLLDEHFPTHGNWQGASLGQVVIVWLAYILSEGDHRLNSVRGWVAGLLMTLKLCLNRSELDELDVTDDRLALILTRLGDDRAWEGYEVAQNGRLILAYSLENICVRVDSTTAKSYVDVSEEGLFQFGHSKERRSDLPQLKINQSVLDPLGIPLTTTIVSGNTADDPLYVPEIKKVQASLQRSGVLYVGDCKMSALATRAYIAAHQDYYLSPLSAVQMPADKLKTLLEPVWDKTQPLTPIYRPVTSVKEKSEQMGYGFVTVITQTRNEEGQVLEWQEQQLIVHSFKHAKAQEQALKERLKKAEQAIAALNPRGRGRKKLDEAATREAVDEILARYQVNGLLTLVYENDTQVKSKRAYGQRPAETICTTTVKVQSSRDATAYTNHVRHLGWRVLVCNHLKLSLTEAVLAYREEYLVERGFNRLRGKLLGITPFFLSSTTRIKGLIRLLSLGLRVLCLVEFEVRQRLKDNEEKLDGIYAGNPKRATAKPTTEMMLKAFRGLTITVVHVDGHESYHTTPLNPVQTRILTLLDFPLTLYQSLAQQSEKPVVKMGEP